MPKSFDKKLMEVTVGLRAALDAKVSEPRKRARDVGEPVRSLLRLSGLSVDGKETQPKVGREIRKLFVGKEQAGSIIKDATSFTIKLNPAMLADAQETQLRDFMSQLFTDSPQR
jgi:hypothetical protein